MSITDILIHSIAGYKKDIADYANKELSKALGEAVNLKQEDVERLTNEYLHDYMNQPNSFQIRVPSYDIRR